MAELRMSKLKTGRASPVRKKLGSLPDIKQQTRTQKSGHLKVGDIVILVTPKTSELNYKGVLSADGVINERLLVIPKYSASKDGGNVLTRSCLFQVQTARRLSKSDFKKSDTELKMTLGKAITYGERIQLRHCHSNGFVYANSKTIASEPGCLQVDINEKGGENSWLEVLPVNKLRSEGDIIQYTDSVCLKFFSEKSDYYLHFHESGISSSNDKLEVNAGGNPIHWNLRRYTTFDYFGDTTKFVTTGDSFKIYHRVSEGYLAVEETSLLEKNDSISLFVEKNNKMSNSLWELQREAAFVGGVACWNERFRIKHLATGMFLQEQEEEIKLVPEAYQKGTLFTLEPDFETPEESIRFGMILTVKTESFKFLKVKEPSKSHSFVSRNQKQKLGIDLSLNKKDYSGVAFVIEDVLETQTEHVYKLNLMAPYLVNFYHHLKKKFSRNQFRTRAKKALDVMLDNLLQKIICKNESYLDFTTKQNSFREMGILDCLVDLADLIADVSKKNPEASNFKSTQKKIYEVTFKIIENNDKNCCSLYQKHENHLMKMLTEGVEDEIASIIKEVFKYSYEFESVDESVLKKWFSNFKTVTRANIKEQTLYLSILKNLCECNGQGVLKYQAYAKRHLLDQEVDFRVLKFKTKNNQPCIEFNTTESNFSLQEFLEKNPFLGEIGLAKESTALIQEELNAVFYLEDLAKDNEYSEYLSSAIYLLANICLDRYKNAINQVKQKLNASLLHITKALQNNCLPDNIRGAYAQLCRVVYVDVDPYNAVSEHTSRCYDWESSDTPREETISLREDLDTLKQIVLDFWSFSGVSAEGVSKSKLKCVNSFLKLTRAMVDFQVVNYYYMFYLLEPICYLLVFKAGYEGTLEKEPHWCISLILETEHLLKTAYNSSVEMKLFELINEALHFLRVYLIRRENFHVYKLQNLFKSCYEYRDFFELELTSKFNEIMQCLDWDVRIRTEYEEITYANAHMDKLFLNHPEYIETSSLKSKSDTTIVLEIYLLKLMFKAEETKNEEIRKVSLELIIQDLNQRKSIAKQFKTLEFLTNTQIKQQYVNLVQWRNRLKEILRTFSQFQEEAAEHDSTFNNALKDSTLITLDCAEIFKTEFKNSIKKEKCQNLLRHSGIHKVLGQILHLEFGSTLTPLFNNTVEALYRFCKNNPHNQKLLIPHENRLKELSSKLPKTTKLLAQILAVKKKPQEVYGTIKNILDLIDEETTYYQLLQLLKSFVLAGNSDPKIQTDILEGILNNNAIKKTYMQPNKTIDFLRPKIEDPENEDSRLLFHIEVINCINACIANNRFGVLQARKLITYSNLCKKIGEERNYFTKKFYLRYLFEAYLAPVEGAGEGGVSINRMEDFFRKVVYQDLSEFRNCLHEIVNLAYFGVYKNIRSQKADVNKLYIFKRIIEETQVENLEKVEQEMKSRFYSENQTEVTLSQEQKKVIKYWNYLSGDESWWNEKYGLLHFLRDCFVSNEVALGESMKQEVAKLRALLRELHDQLQDYSESHPRLDFSNLLMIVNSCREVIPLEGDFEGPESGFEELNSIIGKVREFIIDERLLLQEAFGVFDVDKSGNIEYLEFESGIKEILGKSVTRAEIEAAYKVLDKNSDGVIEFKEFSKHLRKYFAKNPHSVRKRKEGFKLRQKKSYNTTSFEYLLKSKTLEFSETFDKLCKDQDIQELVQKVKSEILDSAIRKKDSAFLSEFIQKLGTAFNKKKHKIYIIKILNFLVAPQKSTPDEYQEVQETLSKAGALELALDTINESNQQDLVCEATELLTSLLDEGNLKVQTKLLEILKSSSHSNLFSYIRKELRNSRDRIIQRAKREYQREPTKAVAGFIGEFEPEEVLLESGYENIEVKHITLLIKLVKLFCVNCFLEFQNFIRNQEDLSVSQRTVSINLVKEIAEFLVNIKEVGSYILLDEEANALVTQCFETLIELCKGPCVDNQLLLGTRKKLYGFLDTVLSLKTSENVHETFYWYGIKFLKCLLEGQKHQEIPQMMIQEIDFPSLGQKAYEIYQKHIHPNLEYIMQERIQNEGTKSDILEFYNSLYKCFNQKPQVVSKENWEKILIGFDIVIITLHLKEFFPYHEKLLYLTISKSAEAKEILNRIQELGGRNEDLFTGIWHFFKKRYKEVIIENPTQEQAYEFYLSLIGTVEIEVKGSIEKCYFTFPSMLAFLSTSMKKKLVYSINRNSHEEKIKSFFYESEKYQLYMNHLQQLSRFRTFSWWSSKSKSLAKITFSVIVLLNLILLFSTSSTEDRDYELGSFSVNGLNIALAVILIILSISIYLFFIIENYPIIIYEQVYKPADSDFYNLPALSKLKGTVLMRYYVKAADSQKKPNEFKFWHKIPYLLFHKENVFNLIIVVLAIFALVNPFFYPFLLLDIIRRSDDLRNILKAITENSKQLGLTVVLGLIILYLFSVFGFLWLGEYFVTQEEGADMNTYCESLLDCFVSTINLGLRAGGGIGDFLLQPVKDDDNYWLRQFFDIMFFLIVSIILLNIIFGIIIDTFADLRDKRKEYEEDVKSVCFVCGREKYEFELRGSGWTQHIQIEHNIWAYLAYIIYIRKKPIEQCDGIERDVKTKIQQNDVSFFPKTAKCLEKYEEDHEGLSVIEEGIQEVESALLHLQQITSSSNND